MGLRRHRNTACNASRSKNAPDKTFDFFWRAQQGTLHSQCKVQQIRFGVCLDLWTSVERYRVEWKWLNVSSQILGERYYVVFAVWHEPSAYLPVCLFSVTLHPIGRDFKLELFGSDGQWLTTCS